MPRFGKKSYKKYPRKKYQRRMVKMSPGNAIPILTPKSMMVKMRYSDLKTFNPAAGLPSSNIYRLNGMFDPDATGVGAQPAGFDEWMGLYRNYTVVGAKISITGLSTSSTASTGRSLFGAYVRNNATLSTGINDILSHKRSVWRPLAAASGGRAASSLTYTWSARKHFAVPRKDSLVGESDYAGTDSANPSNQAYAILFACGANESDNPDPVDLIIKIDYVVVFTNPRTLGES